MLSTFVIVEEPLIYLPCVQDKSVKMTLTRIPPVLFSRKYSVALIQEVSPSQFILLLSL